MAALSPFANIAQRAARKAGERLLQYFSRLDTLVVEEKQFNDFVSEADRTAEAIIVDIIYRAYPDHAILAEESGHHETKSEFTWIIDPLDGTTNFLHGFPQFAVSIGLKKNATLECGVIYDPTRDELFIGQRGQGAQLNNQRLRVSQCKQLPGALIGTGFPFRDFGRLDQYLNIFKAMLQQTSGLRRPGSAALDLAYVAAGRLDGFWEMGLKPWDIAAGALLIQEAGGFVSDFQGNDHFLRQGDVVAGNSRMLHALLQIIQKHSQNPAEKV